MKVLFYPHNLDLSLFGKDAEKVAFITDHLLKHGRYENRYGRVLQDNNKAITVSSKMFREILGENPARIIDLICMTKRHKENGTQPIVKVIEIVSFAKEGKCATYRFVPEYQRKALIYKVKRASYAKFCKRNRNKTKAMIEGLSEGYQKVCNSLKQTTLEMSENQFNELQKNIREKYIENDTIIKKLKQQPNSSGNIEKRIAELDDEHYDSMLCIECKFCEAQDEDGLPVYSCDEQGRLHHYLTNMSEELRPYIRLNGCKCVSYDLGTSQCIFIFIALVKFIKTENITLSEINRIMDEIVNTIKECEQMKKETDKDESFIPQYVQEGFADLRKNLSESTLQKEMKQLGKLLGKDFYLDIMQTIDWKKLPNGNFDRKSFKSKVLFPFLYGKNLSWKKNKMMEYFLNKFPAVYCVLWKIRNLTQICKAFYRLTKKEGVHPKKVLKQIEDQFNTAEFPKTMQREEAKMFYEYIIPNITQPLITIHDSIIVEAGKPCNVREIIEQAFMDLYQIKVRVKVENWHK